MAWELWLGGLKDSKVKDLFNVSYTTSERILKDNCSEFSLAADEETNDLLIIILLFSFTMEG